MNNKTKLMKNENEEKTSTNQEEESTSEKNEDKTSLNEEELGDLTRDELLDKFKEVNKSSMESTAQKKHWREKYEKLQKELESREKPSNKEEKNEKEKSFDTSDRMSRIEFLLEHKDLDKKDLDNLSALALGSGSSLEEAYDSDMFKSYLKDKSLKVNQDEKTLSPTSRSPKIGDKEIDKMNENEMRENWGEIVNSAIKAGKQNKNK